MWLLDEVKKTPAFPINVFVQSKSGISESTEMLISKSFEMYILPGLATNSKKSNKCR